MLKMKMYDYIRYSHYQLDMSLKDICDATNKNWRTVKKAIEGHEPEYKMREQRPKPVMDKYVDVIKGWLIADQKEQKKQRHTAKRIHDRLVEEYDFKGGETTVRGLVRELKQELNLVVNEVFIPSDPAKREGAEVDWGEAQVEINGTRTKVHMFCMRAKYSGKIFVKLYPVMVQECFFNGHIEGFAYFNGIFNEVVYDNLTTAVKKVLKGRDRIEQTAFVSFHAYYCFAAIFCNKNRGNEKGGVEGLVGFGRRNFLTPVPKGESLEEINAHLLEKCRAKDLKTTAGQTETIGELFEQEKGALLRLPPSPYNNYKLILDVQVDKYLTAKVKTNRYSVPHEYAGKKVNIELGLYDVRITYKNKLITEHQREFEKHKWILDPWHYMEILRRKSRAFKTSRILTVIESDWDPAAKQLWEIQVAKDGEYRGTKDFLETILFFRDKNHADMIAVIELAIENKTTGKESIKMLHEMLTEDRVPIEKATTDHLRPISHFTLPAPDVNKFDVLMEVGNG